jgi:hypothetical protein
VFVSSDSPPSASTYRRGTPGACCICFVTGRGRPVGAGIVAVTQAKIGADLLSFTQVACAVCGVLWLSMILLAGGRFLIDFCCRPVMIAHCQPVDKVKDLSGRQQGVPACCHIFQGIGGVVLCARCLT